MRAFRLFAAVYNDAEVIMGRSPVNPENVDFSVSRTEVLRVVAAYGFRIDTSDPRATSLSLTRIAMAYIEVRKHLLAAVGDFTRAPASRATPVKYWTNASDLGALPVALRPPPRYSVQ